jgi:hypothetical protein
MANGPGIKLSQDSVTQEIDLSEVVGKDISNDPLLVRKIGQGIIDYITERSAKGLGIGGNKLKSPYSKDYIKSLPFKAAGKSPNKVDMRLSGDMIGSLDLLEENGSVIKFGIDEPDQAVKGYAHQTGFEGHPTIKGPKREWFGVTIDEIKKNVIPKFKSEIRSSASTLAAILASEEAVAQQNRVINVINASDLFEEEQ